jgi:DeoR/GlpR family transcriptional regulator of sugar metabolism
MDVTPRADVQGEGVFARERQQQIARIVDDAGRARVTDLALRFGVSAVTIRKDLLVLEGERRIVRTHGGAIAMRRDRPEPAFELRERLQSEEKSLIGAAAAELVTDGESIAFDASTTALYVARHLKDRQPWHLLTVVTNGIRIALEFAGYPGITVLMLGGRVRWEALSVVGPLGDAVLKRINIQKAFLGAAGFTIESGLSDAIEEEAQIKRSVAAAAREVYAIADHTKWGRAASATFCRTDRLKAVLTDAAAPPDMVEALRGMGVGVRLLGGDADGGSRVESPGPVGQGALAARGSAQ